MSDLISQVESKSECLLGDEMLKKLFLKKEPFCGEPNTPFVIEAWQAHHHLLQHLILYNNVLMVMTGKDSTGKTTFANGFQASLSGQFLAHKITATENLTAKALQRYIVQLFSLNSVGLDMNDIVGGYLTQLQARKQHCVLIIDDAHLLSDEILQMLFYYISRQTDVAYLHFLLVGDSELIAYIEDQLGDKQDTVHFFELPSMTLNETTSYLSERLCAAGYTGPMPFDKETLQSIYHEAEGDFRQLLILATRSLIALNKANRVKKKPFWKRYLTTGAVSSLFIVLAFALTPLVMREKLKTQTLALPEKRILSTEALLDDSDDNLQFESELKRTASFRKVSDTQVTSTKPSLEVLSVLAKKPTTQKTKSTPSSATTVVRMSRSLKSIETGSLKSKPAIKPEVGKRLIPEPSIEKQFEAIKAARHARENKHHVVLDSVVVLPNPLDGLPAPKSTALPSPSNVKSTKKTANDEASHYVIQLLASSNLQSVRDYAKTHQLPATAKLYKTHVKDREWYTLVIGHYLTPKKAKNALNHLPKSFAKLSPWIRSTKGLGPLSD